MSDSLSGPPGVFSTAVLRRLLFIFPPIALLTGAVVLALHWQERAADYKLHEQAGTHLVDLHATIITRELEEVESELLYLAGQSALQHYLAGDAAGHEELQVEYLNFCRLRRVYDQIRYLDADGRERVRVNFNDGRPAIVLDSELQPKADRYYFTEALRLNQGEVFVSPFDLNVEHKQIERPLKPTLRFATPVFDRAGVKKCGVLVLNYLGAALLRKLAEVSGPFPGTTVLLNCQGHYLRGPTPYDEWGFMLGHDRSFAAQHPEAWSQVAAGQSGQFLVADGLFTYHTIDPRGAGVGPEGRDAGLIVVATTPPAVLEGRSGQLLRLLLLLYAAVLLVLLPLAWYLAYVGTVPPPARAAAGGIGGPVADPVGPVDDSPGGRAPRHLPRPARRAGPGRHLDDARPATGRPGRRYRQEERADRPGPAGERLPARSHPRDFNADPTAHAG